jgi:hypothetical protein
MNKSAGSKRLEISEQWQQSLSNEVSMITNQSFLNLTTFNTAVNSPTQSFYIVIIIHLQLLALNEASLAGRYVLQNDVSKNKVKYIIYCVGGP